MRKYILILLVLLTVSFCDAAITTRIASYLQLDQTATSTSETDFTGVDFIITRHSSDSDIDLLIFGGGKDTYAVNLEFVFSVGSATNPDGATGTQVLYGAADFGPWERITSLAYTVGTASATTGSLDSTRWVDTITATNVSTTTVIDTGNNRMARLNFVNPGYRYLKVLNTEISIRGSDSLGTATITTYIRWHSK